MKFLFWNLYEDNIADMGTLLPNEIELIEQFEIPKEAYSYIKQRDCRLGELCNATHNQKIVYFAPLECRLFLPPFLESLYSILEKNNNTLEIWIGNFEQTQGINTIGIPLPNNRISVINWNTALMYESYAFYKTLHLKDPSVAVERAFVCLNNRVTHYRCKLMEQLATDNLLSHGYVSWHKVLDDSKYSNIFKNFNNNSVTLSGELEFNHSTECYQVIFEENYFKGFVNIITEGEILIKDLSEKTFYAILHKKPFLILGAPGIHQSLTDMGFKLYDTVFDYEFDNESNLDKRIAAITKNVNSIIDKDYRSLRHSISETLDYNYNRYIEILSDNNSVPWQLLDYKTNATMSDYEKSKIKYYCKLFEEFNVGLPS